MLDGFQYWIEVKGYMDAKSATKIKRFRKYYPGELLEVVEKDWFEDKTKKEIEYEEMLKNYKTCCKSAATASLLAKGAMHSRCENPFNNLL